MTNLTSTADYDVEPYGKEEAQSHKSFEQMVGRSIKRHDEQVAAERQARCQAIALDEIAAELTAGMPQPAAYFFKSGFCGCSIKRANPRKYGLEAEFRAGQAARQATQGRVAARTRYLNETLPRNPITGALPWAY